MRSRGAALRRYTTEHNRGDKTNQEKSYALHYSQFPGRSPAHIRLILTVAGDRSNSIHCGDKNAELPFGTRISRPQLPPGTRIWGACAVADPGLGVDERTGGRGGIRTHGEFNPTLDFESSALNRTQPPFLFGPAAKPGADGQYASGRSVCKPKEAKGRTEQRMAWIFWVKASGPATKNVTIFGLPG